MNRRLMFFVVSWSFLITVIGSAAERPNFLFIYTDDQRWDALGMVQREQGDKARFPWFETPNLDRLASEGVRFRNAFVVNSLCAPSRSVFLTGRYSHLNGVANNHTPFSSENIPNTWSSLLQGGRLCDGIRRQVSSRPASGEASGIRLLGEFSRPRPIYGLSI